jgi:propanol-preferring alcohol dehydrogenase
MQAWVTDLPGHRLVLIDTPVPEPGLGEVLVKVVACGVCRTDLHVVDGEIPRHRERVTPGHQVVGTVEQLGDGVHGLQIGQLIGVAWLRRTCGVCTWCRSGQENLCPESEYTGWDADGGLAEFLTVPEGFAYPLAEGTDPVETAPLLCAGIIGYRALARANLPAGGRLGLYGFGSSAHITAQIAMAAGAEVFAMTRGEENRRLARDLGLAFVGEAESVPPSALDSAIVFAPAGNLVPVALQATGRGGTVVLAGIHLSDIPVMSYAENLFHERDLRSVEANTRADGEAFLRLAGQLKIRAQVTTYPFEEAGRALADLRAGRSSGSLVIVMDPASRG